MYMYMYIYIYILIDMINCIHSLQMHFKWIL